MGNNQQEPVNVDEHRQRTEENEEEDRRQEPVLQARVLGEDGKRKGDWCVC